MMTGIAPLSFEPNLGQAPDSIRYLARGPVRDLYVTVKGVAFRPDLETLRILPWQPGTALVICDYVRPDGSLVREAPRSVLR